MPTDSYFSRETLENAATRFLTGCPVLEIKEFGTGNINRTFLVTQGFHEKKPFLLQRLNTKVFQNPDLVLANICSVTRHVRKQLESNRLVSDRRWEIPDFLPTTDGKDHWCSSDGSFWRAMSFIENSHVKDIITGPDHAREVGFALGTFHTLLSDLPISQLADTLPGFHITPTYLERYDEVLGALASKPSSQEEWCLRFVEEHRCWAPLLQNAIRKDWNMVSLSLGFDLTLLIPLRTHFKMAVSSVLQEQTGQTTFWALSHPAANPDFHHRDSFLIVF